MSDTDRLEKKTVLRAPRSRVWRAIADSKEFGTWFGLTVDGPFVQGATMACAITPTKMDAEVARHQEPFAGIKFNIIIETMEPERVFAFRWQPGPPAPGEDRSKEAWTLVSFTLSDAAEGTALTLVESGFDKLPLERRAKAFAGNSGGWDMQMMLIGKYVEKHP